MTSNSTRAEAPRAEVPSTPVSSTNRTGGAFEATLQHLREGIRNGDSSPMRGARGLRTSLRTAHLLAFGALFGGHVFAVSPERLLPALIAVLATGFGFMAFEIWRAPIWVVQVRGLATYLKIALVVTVNPLWEYRLAILSLIVAIGSVVSHMPAQYRYYSVLHRRVMRGGGSG